MLLTKLNYNSLLEQASNNYARLRRNEISSFVLKIYLRMNLLKKSVSMRKVAEPEGKLDYEISFSFSEDRLDEFLQALNII